MATEKKEMVLTENDVNTYAPLTIGIFKRLCEMLNVLASPVPSPDKEGVLEELVSYRMGNSSTIRDFKEQVARAKVFATTGEKFLKEVCSYEPDRLPDGFKWGKQSFIKSFENAHDAIMKLIEIEGTPMENFLQYITPKQAAEAAGITEDRLMADLGDMIISKPKEPTLYVK